MFKNRHIFADFIKAETYMMKLLEHIYRHAESYTTIFAWIVIPLGYYAAYLVLKNLYGMFETPELESKETHATN